MAEKDNLEDDVARLKEELQRRDSEQIAQIRHKHEQRAGCGMMFLCLGGPLIIAGLILKWAPEIFDNIVGQWFLVIATIFICVKVWRFMKSQRDMEISEAERKKFKG